MKRLILGIVLATVVLYVWGFVYWAVLPYAPLVWKPITDETAARDALRQSFPENGTYCVPSFSHDPVTGEKLFAEGPVAFVHMIAVGGRPMVVPSIMVKGFVLNLVVVVLITLLLRQVAAALPTFRDRAKLVVLIGLTAAIAIDGGDVAWWQISWPWKLYQGGYDFSVWLIAGLIMAKFVPATGKT